jgi:hypothetical protein
MRAAVDAIAEHVQEVEHAEHNPADGTQSIHCRACRARAHPLADVKRLETVRSIRSCGTGLTTSH